MLHGNEPVDQSLAGQDPELGGPQQMSAADHLRQAIEHAQAALVGEPSDADSQELAKVVQGLYQILAKRQAEQEKMLQGGLSLSGLARQ